MDGATPRIYLTGRPAVQAGSELLDDRALGSRQGQLLLAFLVIERFRPVTRDELAELLWPDGPAPRWRAGLNALVSKLRQALAAVPAAGASLDGGHGWYQLRVPAATWVDVEQASLSVDLAAAALDAGEAPRAWGDALVAATIARRPFLAGMEVSWVDARRAGLRQVLVRALEAFADACRATDQAALAVAAAAEVAALEPFRESAYRRLMEAHAAAGNRAEALRVFEQCRRLLADELGADPSRETRALHAELLRD